MAKETNNNLPNYIDGKSKKDFEKSFNEVETQMQPYLKKFPLNAAAVANARKLFDDTNERDIDQLRLFTGVAVSQLNFCLTNNK